MYKNIDAARTLGISNAKITNKVKRKGLKKEVFEQLMRGKYTPSRPNDFFIKRIAEINRDLNKKEGINLRNPYLEAMSDINKLIRDNRNTSLSDGEIKFYEEPKTPIIQETPQIFQKPLPATPFVNANAIQDMRVNTNVMQTGLTPTEQALLSPEEQSIRLRQRGLSR